MAKGDSNERAKAKEWSLWWTEGRRDDVFWRIRGSGGRATQRAKSGKQTAAMYGDLMATDPIGEPLIRTLTVEFKKGYNKTLAPLSIIDSDSKGGKDSLKAFWIKVNDDAQKAGDAGWGKEPALIIHRDRFKPLIIIRKQFFNAISTQHDFGKINIMRFRFSGQPEGIIFRQSDFFEIVNPLFFSFLRGYKDERKQSVEIVTR